jgi:hypothetical protein
LIQTKKPLLDDKLLHKAYVDCIIELPMCYCGLRICTVDLYDPNIIEQGFDCDYIGLCVDTGEKGLVYLCNRGIE